MLATLCNKLKKTDSMGYLTMSLLGKVSDSHTDKLLGNNGKHHKWVGNDNNQERNHARVRVSWSTYFNSFHQGLLGIVYPL